MKAQTLGIIIDPKRFLVVELQSANLFANVCNQYIDTSVLFWLFHSSDSINTQRLIIGVDQNIILGPLIKWKCSTHQTEPPPPPPVKAYRQEVRPVWHAGESYNYGEKYFSLYSPSDYFFPATFFYSMHLMTATKEWKKWFYRYIWPWTSSISIDFDMGSSHLTSFESKCVASKRRGTNGK